MNELLRYTKWRLVYSWKPERKERMDAMSLQKTEQGNWKLEVPGQPVIYLSNGQVSRLIQLLDETNKSAAPQTEEAVAMPAEVQEPVAKEMPAEQAASEPEAPTKGKGKKK